MKSDGSKILSRCARYCSEAERCKSDVMKRLDATALDDAAKRGILEQLVKEGFIDESRYSRAFVNDKFRFNRWGRRKIFFELKTRGVPPSVISDALDKIDPEAYEETLKDLLEKKKKMLKAHTSRELLAKLAAYGVSKGFESDLTFKLASQITGATDEEMD